MTVWKIIPVPAGVHVITHVYAGVSLEHLTGRGTLELRREEYADLAVRLGHPGDAFDQDGRPRTITVTGEPPVPGAVEQHRPFVEGFQPAAPVDLRPTSAPVPADWGRTPPTDRGVYRSPLDVRRPAEPGERVEDCCPAPETFPDPSYREPDGGDPA